jgi:acetylglutamate kinase
LKQKLLIAKVGGNIIEQPEQRSNFIKAFSRLSTPKLLIHGGGKTASNIAEKLGIPVQMVDGRRITDKETLDVVTMVYAGLVNKNIVAELQVAGCNALGLTGADSGIVIAHKREAGTVDYGYAGDIDHVNGLRLTNFLNQGLVPVIAPLTLNLQGGLLNTNADTMASAISLALCNTYEVVLLYCFEKKGVLQDPEVDASVISSLNPDQYNQLKKEGIISKGMIPKLDNAFNALRNGVSRVIICHAEDIQNDEFIRKGNTDFGFGTTLLNQ